MHAENQPLDKINELVFYEEDLFNQEKMVKKLDEIIYAWGRELVHEQYIDQIPQSDDAWTQFLSMDIYWGDLKNEWEYYVVGSLIFFVALRSDIKRDFLLQPDYIRTQRLSKSLVHVQHYFNTPLLRDIVTKFYSCYAMIQENKPIKVRYKEIS